MNGDELIRYLLRVKREELGFSARELSQRAGLSPSYINKVESGEISPSLRAFSQIAEALNLNDLEVVTLCRLARQ